MIIQRKINKRTYMKNKNLHEKLEQIKILIDECLAEVGSKNPNISESGLVKEKKTISTQVDTINSGGLILSIVNKVGNCEESEEIQSKVLDKKSMEAKILLCFYISYKYFKNQWLNSGDIEKITSELGIKITTGNVSNKIKDLRQYFESGTTRKQGQPTPYRLNRKGSKHFEETLLIKSGKNLK